MKVNVDKSENELSTWEVQISKSKMSMKNNDFVGNIDETIISYKQ